MKWSSWVTAKTWKKIIFYYILWVYIWIHVIAIRIIWHILFIYNNLVLMWGSHTGCCLTDKVRQLFSVFGLGLRLVNGLCHLWLAVFILRIIFSSTFPQKVVLEVPILHYERLLIFISSLAPVLYIVKSRIVTLKIFIDFVDLGMQQSSK